MMKVSFLKDAQEAVKFNWISISDHVFPYQLKHLSPKLHPTNNVRAKTKNVSQNFFSKIPRQKPKVDSINKLEAKFKLSDKYALLPAPPPLASQSSGFGQQVAGQEISPTNRSAR